MPLQNRVTPFGNLVAVEGRGLLMGNRGRLHDGERRIVRYAQGRRWIACLTSLRGRRRTVMSPGSERADPHVSVPTALCHLGGARLRNMTGAGEDARASTPFPRRRRRR
jgi:hypothetical protein